MIDAIIIRPASAEPIRIEPAEGLPIEIALVDSTPIKIEGVMGIPGPKGADGDTLDPNFIIDGGNF